MTMYKCENDCEFWGEYDELLIAREIDHYPYGNGAAEQVTIHCLCPNCESEELTEWKEAI